MLKVSPWNGVVRFGKRGKLNPRYVGPFKVLEKVGSVAYKLELPQELSRVHNIFHVSNLKKCDADEPLAVLLDGLHIDDKLHFVKEPVEIMDHEVKRLKKSRIPIVKVQWNSKRGLEFTWERKDQFRKKYLHLFTKTSSSLRRAPNIVEPELRTIVAPMAERTMEELLRAPTEGESDSKMDERIDKLADQLSTLVEIVSKKVVTPAPVKAVKETCITCGGAHSWYNCLTTDNNQASVCATTGTYNQVNPLSRVSNQMTPPAFAPVQNNGQN
ncbi:hypothetical protein Tco_1356954, partial [Tanacetum coccineum]